VYGLGRYADGRPYYAMRFIRGESLQEAIRKFHVGDAGYTLCGLTARRAVPAFGASVHRKTAKTSASRSWALARGSSRFHAWNG
jgi:hypothetical protein